MPTPFIHGTTSLVAMDFLQFKMKRKLSLGQRIALIVATLVHDLDLVPGGIVGDFSRFHHEWTHSFVFCLGLASLLSYWARLPFWVFAILSLLHPILDVLVVDLRQVVTPRDGVPLLWPFSDLRVFSVAEVFTAPYFGFDWERVFSLENMVIVLREALVPTAYLIISCMVYRRGLKLSGNSLDRAS